MEGWMVPGLTRVQNLKCLSSLASGTTIFLLDHISSCPSSLSSATGRLVTAKDHAAVQLNVADVDESGRLTGTSKTYVLSGFVRSMSESDDSLNRLCSQDGYLKK